MRTIVLGYSGHDSSGLGHGPATLLAGPEVESQKQLHIVTEKKFPKGIGFAEIVNCTRLQAAGSAQPKPETKTKESK